MRRNFSICFRIAQREDVELNGSELVLRTGYFSKAPVYAEAGFALVSIALKPAWFLPKHLRLFQLRHLCPTEEMLFLKNKPEEYVPLYKEQVLDKTSADAMLSRFRHIADEAKTDKVVLLCWEGPGKFCHRHLVADWLRKNAGIKICEFGKEDVA